MEAGRELDALVAEKVMGWSGRIEVSKARSLKSAETWRIAFKEDGFDRSFGDYSHFVDREGMKIYLGSPHKVIFPPCYSTSMAAAWGVVEKMRGLGYEFALIADEQRPDVLTYAAEFDKYNGNIGETTYIHGQRADAAPLAICLAALSALGVSVNA